MHADARSSLALTVVAIALSACDGRKTETPTSATPGLEPIMIRYADPGNAGVLAYAKREGILERELAKANARIEWVPAAGAFSANFEAMNAGAINASGGAISPIIGALAHNLRFKIYGISDRGGASGRQAGIIVPGNSPVASVEDLVGKRVAVNWAAHGDYILLKALKNVGVSPDLVTRVPIQPPDAAAAFATGKIDGWSTFGVFYNTAVRNGARILATEANIDSDDVGVYSAHADVLQKNPVAFQIFLAAVRELTLEAHKNPEKFQNVFADKGPTAVQGDNLRLAIEETRGSPLPHAPTAEDRQRVANVAALFVAHKSIDRALTVDEIVFDLDAAAARAQGGAK